MKIRVLEILATLRRAGAERVAVSLACGLDRARFETGVASLYPAYANGFEPILADAGVPVWHLGKRRGLDPRMWSRLARLVRDFRPHLIHTHSYVLRYALPARALTRTGALVHTVHNLADKEVDALGRAIHRMAFRCGAVPVAISAELARSFRAVYGFPPAAVIPNGICTRPAPDPAARETWRHDHGFCPADVLLVSLARLEPQKNPLGLIEAFAHALPAHTGLHLAMAGEGSLLESCRALAERLGVARRVHFLGLCRDAAALLAAGDMFVLSSAWEGVPLALMEAMAAGLPVVATAVGGVPELVEEGVTGALAPAGDTAALAAAIASLACDPARRFAMGRAAAARAVQFDVRDMVGSYAALFERLCQGAA